VSVSEILSSLGVPEGTASDGTASDGTVQTRINLHNETQLKDLLDIGLTPEQRSQHADALLDGITVPAGQPGVPLLHRLIRHVVGNDELSDEDRAQLAPALPITAHVITQKLAAEPAKGPGGGTKPAPMQVDSVWDVSTPDGSLKVIDLPNGIELLPGGCIVARSTPLHFTCTSLLREGAPPAGYGDFNILGATGAAVPTPPIPPPAAQAAAGAPGQCSSVGIAGEGGGPGSPGLQSGTAGAPGLVGNNGIASAIATISITGSLGFRVTPKEQLVVATQSGPGGPGGAAGQPGAAGKHSTAGATAGPGAAGDPGASGNAGTLTGAAAQVTVTTF
jgi:hypothetical protein